MARGQFVLRKHVRGTKLRRSLATFLSILAIVASARSARIPLRRLRNKKPSSETERLVDPTVVKLALFPTLFPELYSYLRRHFETNPRLSELLASPLLLLLPLAWRMQLALYAASSAIQHSGQGSKLRRFLPPTWTLNVIGNAWLLYAFLFKSRAFPKSYERVILSHSSHYVPRNMSKLELEEILTIGSLSEREVGSPGAQLKHQNELCAKLHPNEPSCLKNYVDAWLHESLRVCRWVGVFSALPILLSKPRRMTLMSRPLHVLKSWLISTSQGTVFVVGSINTSWAIICLLQRILPHGFLRWQRWLINGFITSFWILVLPAKRRAELALYVARLAALCAWRVWRLDGGKAIPYGEIVLFALSWMQLARLQRRGEKITGLVGLGLERLRPSTNNSTRF